MKHDKNIKAAFDHARKLVQVTNPQEAMRIQSEFLRSQFTSVDEHVRKIAGRIASDPAHQKCGRLPHFPTPQQVDQNPLTSISLSVCCNASATGLGLTIVIQEPEFDPSGRFIVVPDKGLDLVFTYRIDAAARKLVSATPPVQAREGAGPRHIAFSPGGRTAYVINELDSTVTAYKFDPDTGTLTPFQIVSSLPETFTGNSRASEIAVSPDGRFVYASNRGYDSVALFAVDPSSARLFPVSWQTSDGKTPRFFVIDPQHRFMFVANEDSDAIVPFDIDQPTGKLTRTSGPSVAIGSPVCILFKAMR